MSIVLGVIAVCLDIAILDTIGMNPDYSADVRWACFALVAWFTLPPLYWIFMGNGIKLEDKWQHNCRAKRRVRATAARLKGGH
ncbi:hypothetical protein [Shewanella oncorhynchi]|uniref:hypothetical protein n=1 Tax=Shewanella oncorhynchi TaxID=2726434 RepID=UPI003D793E7C